MPNDVLEALAHNCIPITLGHYGVMKDMYNGNNMLNSFILSNHNQKIMLKDIDIAINEQISYKFAKNSFTIKIIS